jgi:large subunit ribosomal protein L25
MQNTLHANMRSNPTKGENNRLRKTGRIPGVVYGLHNPNFNVEFAEMEILDVLKKAGQNGIVSIDVNGSNEQAMIKDVQRDPVTKKLTHIDLQRIDNSQIVHAKIPVVIRGEERLKGSGVMAQVQLNEIDVECTPDKLPKYIVADISRFEVGQQLTVRDLEIAEEIAVLNEPNTIIAALSYIKSNTNENILPNAAGSMHPDNSK